MEKFKPLLKFLTTIDFGKLTYKEEFLAQFKAANLEVLDFGPYTNSDSRIESNFYLCVAKPMKILDGHAYVTVAKARASQK